MIINVIIRLFLLGWSAVARPPPVGHDAASECGSESNFEVSRARLTQRIGGCISPVGTGSSRLLTLPG